MGCDIYIDVVRTAWLKWLNYRACFYQSLRALRNAVSGREMKEYVKPSKIEEVYFSIDLPKCAKAYGRNYVCFRAMLIRLTFGI